MKLHTNCGEGARITWAKCDAQVFMFPIPMDKWLYFIPLQPLPARTRWQEGAEAVTVILFPTKILPPLLMVRTESERSILTAWPSSSLCGACRAGAPDLALKTGAGACAISQPRSACGPLAEAASRRAAAPTFTWNPSRRRAGGARRYKAHGGQRAACPVGSGWR